MSAAEIISLTGIVILLAVAARYLFGYELRLPRGENGYGTQSPLDNGSMPFKAGPDGHPLPLWGAGDAMAVAAIGLVGVYAVLIIVLTVTAVGVGAFAPDYEIEDLLDSPAGNAVFLSLQWAVMVGLPLLYLRNRGYLFDRFTFGFRPTRNVGYSIGIWIAVMFACWLFFPAIYTSIIEAYEPYELPDQEITEPFGLTWGGFIITFITVALVTPVIEEFFFRGIIHQGLERRLGFVLGATVSSAIFAFFHIPFFGLMPIFFILGFGFAILLRTTGSLWPPIAGHFVVNTVGVLVSFEELF